MARKNIREFSKKVKAPLNKQSKEVCLSGFFLWSGSHLVRDGFGTCVGINLRSDRTPQIWLDSNQVLSRFYRFVVLHGFHMFYVLNATICSHKWSSFLFPLLSFLRHERGQYRKCPLLAETYFTLSHLLYIFRNISFIGNIWNVSC